ncbi:16509_t:CDS:2, partial [Cetraspora pellucida]
MTIKKIQDLDPTHPLFKDAALFIRTIDKYNGKIQEKGNRIIDKLLRFSQETQHSKLILLGLLKFINSEKFKYDKEEIFEELNQALDLTLEPQKLVHLTENFYTCDFINEFSLEMRISVILEDLRQKLLKKIVSDDTEPLDNFNYLVKKVEKELGLIRSKNTKNFRES